MAETPMTFDEWWAFAEKMRAPDALNGEQLARAAWEAGQNAHAAHELRLIEKAMVERAKKLEAKAKGR